MDEIELRLAALELIVVEVIAWLDPVTAQDACLSIRASLAGDICDEERAIRMQALQLIDDGRLRFHGPAMGIKV